MPYRCPPYMCPYCFKTFLCPMALRDHVNCHIYKNKKILEGHRIANICPSFMCPYCGKSFLWQEMLSSHVKNAERKILIRHGAYESNPRIDYDASCPAKFSGAGC